jgi:hypothetical protein
MVCLTMGRSILEGGSDVVGMLGIPDCGSMRLRLRNGQVCRDGHTYAVPSAQHS